MVYIRVGEFFEEEAKKRLEAFQADLAGMSADDLYDKHVLKPEPFYARVSARGETADEDKDVERYYFAALQASNDRVNRVTRGEIVQRLLEKTAGQKSLFHGKDM